jgi:hypothetical protein
MAKSTKPEQKNEEKITNSIKIDGEDYNLEDASDVARQALNSLQFAERKIAQLRGEMSLATTARTGFINILKNELKK